MGQGGSFCVYGVKLHLCAFQRRAVLRTHPGESGEVRLVEECSPRRASGTGGPRTARRTRLPERGARDALAERGICW